MPETTEILKALKAELKFLEGGGYIHTPHKDWHPPLVFEDSPSCPNFGDSSRPHACDDCWLMQFVPEQHRDHDWPCRMIPLTPHGETIDHLYGYGTQGELEAALKGWLGRNIREIEGKASGA